MHRVEVCLRLPAAAAGAQISMLLTKTLLYVHEYPPDAHRGFDIAGTRVVAALEGSASAASAARCRAMLDANWLADLVRA
jgi:Gpi16 subunit, GPI transamidase component